MLLLVVHYLAIIIESLGRKALIYCHFLPNEIKNTQMMGSQVNLTGSSLDILTVIPYADSNPYNISITTDRSMKIPFWSKKLNTTHK
jgi:hypothetical protein